MLSRPLTVAFVVSACCGVFLPSHGAAQPPLGPIQGQSNKRYTGWALNEENDSFAIGSGSDRNYTQGLRYTLFRNLGDPGVWQPSSASVPASSRLKAIPAWIRPKAYVAKLLNLKVDTTAQAGIAFGQNIYTPQNINIAKPILDDRPYGAVLYGTYFVNFLNPDQTRQQFLELQLGWVGPPALGAGAQSGFHKLISDRQPKGWSHQLKFEPIVNLNYNNQRRFILVGSNSNSTDDVSVDFVPELGFNLGNLFTRANAGGQLRFGRFISGFPVGIISPSASNPKERPWRAYLFTGVQGHAVARNLFIDGNTFASSQSVTRVPWVYELLGGFNISHRNWDLNYTFIHRSQEFTPPPAQLQVDSTFQDVGSINFRIRQNF